MMPTVDPKQLIAELGTEAIPTPEILLCGRRPPEWLRQLYERALSNPVDWGRALAVGTVARLWVPDGTDKAMFELLLSGDGPAARAHAWWARQHERAWAAVEESALMRIATLRRQLLDWSDTPRAAPVADFCAWITERDDLESVAFLWGESRERTELHCELVELDALTERRRSVFAGLDLSGDSRFEAVSWQEPHLWWGALACPESTEQT